MSKCIICGDLSQKFFTVNNAIFCYECYNLIENCKDCNSKRMYNKIQKSMVDSKSKTITLDEYNNMKNEISELKNINEKLINRVLPEKCSKKEINDYAYTKIKLLLNDQIIDIPETNYEYTKNCISIKCPKNNYHNVLDLFIEKDFSKKVLYRDNKIIGTTFELEGEEKDLFKIKDNNISLSEDHFKYLVRYFSNRLPESYFKTLPDDTPLINGCYGNYQKARTYEYNKKIYVDCNIYIEKTLISYYFGLDPSNDLQYINKNRKYFYIYENIGQININDMDKQKNLIINNDDIIVNHYLIRRTKCDK